MSIIKLKKKDVNDSADSARVYLFGIWGVCVGGGGGGGRGG